MSDLKPREQCQTGAKAALYLLFRIGDQRFALDVREVIEVMPVRALKPIAQAPGWVVGVLGYRGAVVPVLDLSALSFGTPAPRRTSTRLVLVHYRRDPARPDLQLGLILEQATNTLRCCADEFQPYGLDNAQAKYLGPVRQDSDGLVQRIRLDDLLEAQVHALLFPDEAGQVQA